MIINGLVKLTLLDYPDKLACTVFTAGCNLRCPFCHNASLVTHLDEKARIPEDEVLSFLDTRKNKLEGVCVSGGEPLMQKDIAAFLSKIKEKGFAVKLDTNGTYFEKLKELTEARLVDYVAMDVKNCRENYGVTVGRDVDTDEIALSVDLLKQGTVDYEFRTTVVNELHDEASMVKTGEWLKGAKALYLQKFVDSGDLICDGLSACSDEQMKHFKNILEKYVQRVEIRG